MFKIKPLLLCLCICNGFEAFAQAPDIEWQKSLGGSNYEYPTSIIQTFDSGYIVSGYTSSNDGDITGYLGAADYWVVKLDTIGNIQWQKSYGGSGTDYGGYVLQTIDGGYLVTGVTVSTDGDVLFNHGLGDAWVIKLGILGNIEWQKSYGGSLSDGLGSIQPTTDGGYIAAGYSYSNDGDVAGNHGNSDYWILKIDNVGSIEWQKCLGGSAFDNASAIHQTSNGGYIVSGVTLSDDGDITEYHGGGGDFWIVRLDSGGNILWQRALGGSGEDSGHDIIETSDNGFIATAGFTASTDGDVTGHHGAVFADYWVIKIDSIGNLLWQKCLGGTGSDEANSIVQISDTGFLIAGGSSTNNNGDVTGHHGTESYSDYWLVKLDTNANIEWQKSLGGTHTDIANSIIETLDSGYVVAGYAFSNDDDITGHHGVGLNTDYWIVKLEKPCDQIIYFADSDSDGYGDSTTMIYSCFDTIGYVLDNTDCNDSITEIHPGTLDVCNNLDDNCNGIFDEDAIFLTWYMDDDSDGYGNNTIDSITCFELSGFVFDNTDCNDTNNLINPGTFEICNSLDENCNLLIDEDLTFTTYFIDADEDNYGNAAIDSVWCSTIIGFITDSTDCDDNDPDINPGIPEIFNGIDDNCNKLIDEGLAINEVLLNAINIYPNPTDNILHIALSGYSEVIFEVINIDGQIIWRNYVFSSIVELDVEGYTPGIYLLKIITKDGEASAKFVKE